MNSKLFYFLTGLFVFSVNGMHAQYSATVGISNPKFTLSGILTDSKNNETLIGVNVFIPELKTGTTTNEYGFYCKQR